MSMIMLTKDGRKTVDDNFCLAQACEELARLSADGVPDNELWAHIYEDDGVTWLYFLFVDGAEIVTRNQRTGESDAILMFFNL